MYIGNLLFLVMAAKPRHKWSQEDLEAALNAVHEENLSLREAAGRYGIPKSTISTYLTGKSVIGKKPGPATILTPGEEKKLLDYALHMSEIGYGRTKDQLLEMVQKLMKAGNRPNPFTNDKPGKKWWRLFPYPIIVMTTSVQYVKRQQKATGLHVIPAINGIMLLSQLQKIWISGFVLTVRYSCGFVGGVVVLRLTLFLCLETEILALLQL